MTTDPTATPLDDLDDDPEGARARAREEHCARCAAPILAGIIWCRACHAATIALTLERFPDTPTQTGNTP